MGWKNLIFNPEWIITRYSNAAKSIEKFIKKAEPEIKKGTLLGYFYIAIALILLAIFALISTGFIIFVGGFFPDRFQWLVSGLATVPFIAVIYFIIRLLTKENDGPK